MIYLKCAFALVLMVSICIYTDMVTCYLTEFINVCILCMFAPIEIFLICIGIAIYHIYALHKLYIIYYTIEIYTADRKWQTSVLKNPYLNSWLFDLCVKIEA